MVLSEFYTWGSRKPMNGFREGRDLQRAESRCSWESGLEASKSRKGRLGSDLEFIELRAWTNRVELIEMERGGVAHWKFVSKIKLVRRD